MRTKPKDREKDEPEIVSPGCSEGIKTFTEPDATPGVIRSHYTPRTPSHSMLTSIRDFFTIMNQKSVKSQQVSTAMTFHSRTFNSEEQLVSREENAIHSKELAANLCVLQSPIESMEIKQSKSEMIDEMPHILPSQGSQNLKEEPRFSDYLTPSMQPKVESSMWRGSAIIGLSYDTKPPLSFTQSAMQHEVTASTQPVENPFLRSAFLKRKLSRAQLLHNPRRAHSAISENWVLTSSSKTEVVGDSAVREQTTSLNNYSFAYLVKSEEEEISDGSQPSDRAKHLFQRFAHLSLRYTSKEAYLMLLPLAGSLIASHVKQVAGDWSGVDVKPHSDEVVNLDMLNNFSYSLWKPGYRGSIQKMRSPVFRLVESKAFGIFMTACVVLNTVTLAVNHYQIDPDLLSALENVNLGFTVLFAIEMVLKMASHGFLGYFHSRMNMFDCAVVSLSILELSFLSGSGLSALRAIRVFRVFRVLRVARLFRYFKYMQEILKVIEKSMANLAYMGLLILLFLIVASLFGMQLFGGVFNFPDGKPRANYDDFHHAFLTSFQLLTMENWFSVLYSGMRTNMGYFAAIYFVIWIFFGNFVLLNLFLAIMLNSFASDDKESEFDEDDLQVLEQSSMNGVIRQRSHLKVSKKKKKRLDNILKKMEEIRLEEDLSSESGSAEVMLSAQREKPLFVRNECQRSWRLFSQASKVRIWCFRITSSSMFEWAILFLIAVSSIKLIWETYFMNDPAGSKNVVISDNVDIAFTVLFTLEFLLKSIALGFVFGQGTYLRDTWNVLDFVIIVVSFADICFSDINMPIIKIFRLLRALRPLRFISHNESMRIIVNALLESMAALANVTVVVLIVLLIFAILGVSLMAGRMYTCTEPSIQSESECVYYGYEWENAPYHYDHVIAAYLALFDLISQENWPDQMYRGTDVYEIGYAMRENYNPLMAYFFVVFVVIGNIFFLNMLLGVMFNKFERAKRNNSSIATLLLKNEQLRWIELMKYIIRTKRVQEKIMINSRSRQIVLGIINHWTFGAVIMLCIVSNMISMAIAYDQASIAYASALEDANLVFTCVFAVEACLKLYGLTVKGYFKDRWNCFDFFITIAPFVDIILSMTLFASSSSNKILTVGPQLVRVLRILRVSRLLRLVKKLRMIDDLIGMISLSLPAIGNVFMLLLLVFMIYGVLGVFLFHTVRGGIIIDEDNNFSNFGRAVLILIRVSTGEDWNYVLTDISTSTSSYYSSAYLVSFVCITTFIMYNMFIMVMLQEYESYHNNPHSSFKIYKENLKSFNTAWNNSVTEQSKTRLDGEGLIAFAYEMGKIIEVEQTMDRYKVKTQLGKLGLIPDEQGFVYYHEALFRFFKAKFGIHKNLASKIHKKLLEIEETFHTKRIKKLVQVEKIRSVAKLMKNQGHTKADMRIYDLIFLKAIFKSWHKYAQDRRSRTAISDTPPMYMNHPGSNSPHSIMDSSEEEIEEDYFPEIKIKEAPIKGASVNERRSVTLPRVAQESNSDVKLSRTSTNFSKNRHDSQD